ncbi:MAG: PEGA domain-containing protein [Patescibacteria group bacterium]|nr:PEGA domain-containing protein [Patescibacteria group bacterium]
MHICIHKFFITLLVVLCFTILGALFVLRPKFAGIVVNTEPKSFVFVNGLNVGETPYEGIYTPGEIAIEVVPLNSDFLAYQTKLDLVEGVKTFFSYNSGLTEDQTSVAIVSFEKGFNKETGIVIVSEPYDVTVFVNGVKVGLTPYKSNLSQGEYLLSFEKEGYQSKSFLVKVIEGYKLTTWIKLSSF